MKNLMKKALWLLPMVILTVVLIATVSMAVVAPVEKGTTFEVPISCNCGDASGWNLSVESGCVSIEYYNPGTMGSTAVCRAVSAGNDIIVGNCGHCGGRTYYAITVIDNSKPQPIGLYLSESNLSMDEGNVQSISAYWSAGTRTDLSWSSSNPGVAYVNGSGGTAYITANSAGDTVITVRDSISGEKDVCYVHVNKAGKHELRINQPSGANYQQGDSARALNAQATLITPSGSSTTQGITYQWYSGTSYTNISTPVYGATSPTYYPPTANTGTMYYSCIATYAVGSVDLTTSTSPVAITVSGEQYGIYVTASQAGIYSGNSVNVTARVYKGNGTLVTGTYPVTWVLSSTGYGTLANSTTNAYNGTATNLLTTYVNYNTNVNQRVYATVNIGGRTYQSYTDITVYKAYAPTPTPTPTPVTNKYSVAITTGTTKLTSGQKTNLTARVCNNGTVVTTLNPEVRWSLSNANDRAFLLSTNTNCQNGAADNTLQAAYPDGNATSKITVKAEVTINGAIYSGTATVDIQAVQDPKRIVLQIDNKMIRNGSDLLANDVAPVIKNNRTMVPVAVVTQLLGGQAGWENATRTVTLTFPNKILTMQVGQIIEGFDAAPMIMNNRTYVPIAYVGQAIGANVEWVSGTRQIVITK